MHRWRIFQLVVWWLMEPTLVTLCVSIICCWCPVAMQCYINYYHVLWFSLFMDILIKSFLFRCRACTANILSVVNAYPKQQPLLNQTKRFTVYTIVFQLFSIKCSYLQAIQCGHVFKPCWSHMLSISIYLVQLLPPHLYHRDVKIYAYSTFPCHFIPWQIIPQDNI